MYLYEIKRAIFEKRVVEQSSADIDRDLEKTAANIGRAAAPGQEGDTDIGLGGDLAGEPTTGEFGAAPDPAAEQSPLQAQDELAADLPMGAEPSDEEEEELLMKKIDSILLSAAKGHRYAKGYRHPDNSKIHPYKILGMSIDELQQLRTMARNLVNKETFSGELGTYDNPDIRFFEDLVSFVDTVIDVKKSSTKEYKNNKEGKTANFDTKEEPKTKAGKVKTKKPSNNR